MKKEIPATLNPVHGNELKLPVYAVTAQCKAAARCYVDNAQALLTHLRNLQSIVHDCEAAALLIEEAEERASKSWYRRSADAIEKQTARKQQKWDLAAGHLPK